MKNLFKIMSQYCQELDFFASCGDEKGDYEACF